MVPSNWPTRLAVSSNVTVGLWPMQNFDPKTTDTKILQDAFSTCGDVRSAILVKGLGGQSTGAGYIHFEDHQSAKVSWHAALKQTLHLSRDAIIPRALKSSTEGAVHDREHEG